jgi:hypothetical protein
MSAIKIILIFTYIFYFIKNIWTYTSDITDILIIVSIDKYKITINFMQQFVFLFIFSFNYYYKIAILFLSKKQNKKG